eukprot:8730438-Pyramimonas_sp.AAC.1
MHTDLRFPSWDVLRERRAPASADSAWWRTRRIPGCRFLPYTISRLQRRLRFRTRAMLLSLRMALSP